MGRTFASPYDRCSEHQCPQFRARLGVITEARREAPGQALRRDTEVHGGTGARTEPTMDTETLAMAVYGAVNRFLSVGS
jgi:hypothetical protein